jgi:hypothetical protein
MKLIEKLTEGAGIAANYAGGIAAIGFGGFCTLISLVILGIGGVNVFSLALFLVGGLTPIGGGIWLIRRGKILKELFQVKLQKDTVRRIAFRHRGRLRPADLARHQDWSEDRALDVLKNLVAEDPERVELQLDYESGDIYFEFPDIQRTLETQGDYYSLPISETLGRQAVDIAVTLGKTIETFHEYVKATQQSVSEHQKQQRDEKYRAKIEKFLQDLDDLKRQ